jgi:hypothetical protein
VRRNGVLREIERYRALLAHALPMKPKKVSLRLSPTRSRRRRRASISAGSSV